MTRARTMPATMPDLRAAVLEALEAKGWSRTRLVEELKGKRPDGTDVPKRTILAWLAGTTNLGASDLGLVFDSLGIGLKLPRK